MEKVMHETARRLLEAARHVRKDIEGPSDLARVLNQSEQTINNWSYRGGGVSKQGRLQAQKELGISATWIEDGSGPMLAVSKHISAASELPKSESKESLIKELPNKDGRSVDEQDLPHPTEDEFAYVPQLDITVACGNGRFEDHVVVKGGLAFKKSFLRSKGVPESSARIVYAAGGSMSPTLQDGCVVLLNLADTEPRDGKVYAICKPDDGLVLKRLIWDFHPAVGRQTWIMRSDNPDKIAHPDKMLPIDDRTMIAGRAVWNDNSL